jgi:paraquat-inducible protein B
MSDSGRNQAVIGAFVVGTVVLAVLAVIVFGSGKLFKDVDHFVMYFEGSVKGLKVGAPVTFRGVKIGSVTDITLRANPKTLKVRIPVVIEVDKGRIERTVDMPYSLPEKIKRLIEKGLRAKLELQSMVTGQLQINMEFLPNEPARLSGFKSRYMEIPTVPTTFEIIAKKFERLPIEEMANNLSESLASLKTVLTNPALPEMINRLDQVSVNIEAWTTKLHQRTTPLLNSLQRIADHADQLVLSVDAQMKPMAGDAKQALSSLRAAADRIGRTADNIAQLSKGAQPAIDNAGQMFANVAGMTDPDARARNDLRNTLKELSAAARSLRNLADYLARHPEALITGKGGSKRR